MSSHTPTAADAWLLALPLLNTRPLIRLADRRGTRTAYPRRNARRADRYASGPPTVPAAVHVYDTQGFTRFLPVDLDAHDATAEQITAVETDLRALVDLLDRCGLVHLTDRAHGGAHVYILLADPLSANDARTLIDALAQRFATVDPSPTTNASDGLITIPGSAHARGGHRELATSIEDARAIAQGPHSPATALNRLRIALADELRALTAADRTRGSATRETARASGARDTLTATIPTQDIQAVHVRGHGRYMSTRCSDLATAGDWRAHGYPSASEARRAVLMSAVATGIPETQIRQRMLDGTWPGLRSLFEHKGLHRLHDEYDRAAAEITRRERKKTATPVVTSDDTPVRSDTSATTHTGGSPLGNDVYGTIRTWSTLVATHASAELSGPAGWDRQMMLRSLGKAASMVGSTTTAMGVRWHALGSALGRTEAAAQLRALAQESDPWVTLVARGHGVQADTYMLRIPDRHRAAAETTTWRRGRTHAVRPLFSVLGKPAGLLYEAIEHGHRSPRSRLALLTGLRDDAYRDARDTLLAYGLITGDDRTGYELTSTEADLERLAQQLGAIDARTRRIHQHRRERCIYWQHLASLRSRLPWVRDVRINEDPPPDDEMLALLDTMRLTVHPGPLAASA